MELNKESLHAWLTTHKLNITEAVTEAILQQYEPATTETTGNDIDFLSSIEIINQFSATTTLDTDDIAEMLASNGFKLRQVAGEYKWVLKRKSE